MISRILEMLLASVNCYTCSQSVLFENSHRYMSLACVHESGQVNACM